MDWQDSQFVFLKIWGCEAFVKRLQSDKLAPKSNKCIFVGYPNETLGYYFYNQSEGKVFVAQNRVFLEKEFLKEEKSGRTVQLEEVRDEPIGQDCTSDANIAEQVEMSTSATTKVSKAPHSAGIIIVRQ